VGGGRRTFRGGRPSTWLRASPSTWLRASPSAGSGQERKAPRTGSYRPEASVRHRLRPGSGAVYGELLKPGPRSADRKNGSRSRRGCACLNCSRAVPFLFQQRPGGRQSPVPSLGFVFVPGASGAATLPPGVVGAAVRRNAAFCRGSPRVVERSPRRVGSGQHSGMRSSTHSRPYPSFARGHGNDGGRAGGGVH